MCILGNGTIVMCLCDSFLAIKLIHKLFLSEIIEFLM